MRGNPKDMTGLRFGRLLVVRQDGVQHSALAWMCKCDCGADFRAYGPSLRKGATKSCGCLVKETMTRIAKTHGLSGTPAHQSWTKMKERCLNPRHRQYSDYGGRGIRVCDKWLAGFEYFLADMGERPVGTTLDRIDNDGNYEPGNCRWATRLEQARNARHVRAIVRSDGKRFVAASAAVAEVGGTQSALRRACVSGRQHLGFTWQYEGIERGAAA